MMKQNFILKSGRLCFLLFLLFAALGIQAQSVSGFVRDETGAPLTGVTIRNVSQPGIGSVSDAKGFYSIKANKGDVISVEYTGYEAQQFAVAAETAADVTLQPGDQLLKEAVVVGYGTQKRSDLTGAVASVTGDQIRSSVTTNFDQALQGRVSGVQVTQNSGAPGGAASIRIRGANSLTLSNEPLYVIDGIPIQGDGYGVAGFDWAGGANGQNVVNPLSAINPADIVSIEVLKDASATAIYGARAANGVIMVTTRRGSKDETKVSYSGYYANQVVGKTLDMMDLSEFAAYQLQVSNDLGLQPNPRYLDPSLLGKGTDWQKEIFQNAGMQSHQLSISGGVNNTTYAISGSVFDQDGIILGSNFKRQTVRVNLDNQVRDWMKVGASVTYANINEKITLNDGSDGVVTQALVMQPDVAVKDFDGNWAGPEIQAGASTWNPVALALLRTNSLARKRLLANFYGDVQLWKGATFRSEIGMDDNSSINKAFQPTYKFGILENNENQLRQRNESSFFWIWKNYLTQNLHFSEKQHLTVLLGQEAQKSSWEGLDVRKRNFASNDIQVLSEGEDSPIPPTGWKDAASIASYFTRLNYNFDDKYFATITLRADGSSKFGPQNRWGFFPSGSLAWRASRALKLRLGYGEVGNQGIPNYLYGSALQTINTPFGTAYRPSNIPNPQLKWESTRQWNLGADIRVLRDRLDVNIDVYQKYTNDMLLQVALPGYLGGPTYADIGAPFANVGKLENKGIDLTINSRNVRAQHFRWNTDLTLSLNRNKITALNDEGAVFWRNLYWYSEFQTATQTTIGQPVGQFYGYVTEGIFKDEADILSHAVQVANPADPSKNYVDKRAGVWIGDVKFKDLDGDGRITTKDQRVIGNPNPDFTFGINNSFSYRNFDLVVYLNGSYGGDILNYQKREIEGMTSVFNNQSATVADRAQYELLDPNGSALDPRNVVLANEDATLPRPTTTDNNRNTRMSDRWIEDGSYLRIQNLRLGYTLPKQLLSRYHVSSLRVYINAQNIYTLTKYSGYDPEIGAFNQSPLLQNVDMGRYPTPRVFTFGLDVDF